MSGRKDPSGKILSEENSTATASTRPATDFSDVASSHSMIQSSDPSMEPSGILASQRSADDSKLQHASHSAEVTARPFGSTEPFSSATTPDLEGDLERRLRLSQNRQYRSETAVARLASPSDATTQKASIRSTCEEIDKVCQSMGGVYATYSCKTVSWGDSRTLECGITDTRLVGKSGELLHHTAERLERQVCCGQDGKDRGGSGEPCLPRPLR